MNDQRGLKDSTLWFLILLLNNPTYIEIKKIGEFFQTRSWNK